MAITLKIGISNLHFKFFADALVIFGAFQATGAVATGALKTFPDGGNHFFVLI